MKSSASSSAQVPRKLVESGMTLATDGSFTVGDKVRIVEGPFEGIEGKVTEQHNHRKFVVHIESLNRNLTVDLGGVKVERI